MGNISQDSKCTKDYAMKFQKETSILASQEAANSTDIFCVHVFRVLIWYRTRTGD